MIPRVTTVEVSGPYSLRLTFHDGVRKQVNLLGLLRGPIFEPLLEPGFFRQVLLDPVAGTVVWPNGADVAPETLYGLPEELDLGKAVRPRRSPSKPLQRSAGAGKVAESPASRRRAGRR